MLPRNGFQSTKALLDAIDAGCAIPESEWSARKAAFNEIGVKAPLRSGRTSDFAITHSDIPGFLEREWYEFTTFSSMTRNINCEDELDAAVAKYWLTDEQTDYSAPAARPDSVEVEEQAPRM